MANVANHIRSVNAMAQDAQLNENNKQVDFKMVTFSLAGKDYGIDIMKVKEIAQFVNFTYVPNTPSFVRGVYNLRGEIISIIDLRAMFNLHYQQKAKHEEEAGLILRLDSNFIGVIVDKIDKVVGINSASIQPPHPIFGDINIKYISGVVENEGRLYIILDVEKVLGKPEESRTETKISTFTPEIAEPDIPAVNQQLDNRLSESSNTDEDQYKTFIAESLHALCGFTVSELNLEWFEARFLEWTAARKGKQVQLRTQDEAKEYLSTFYSPFTAQLWGEDYFNSVYKSLPGNLGNIIQVWNPGCGRGYETYSFACVLRKKYPEAQIKIWASDKDLLSISAAPNLVLNKRDVPEVYQEFVTEGRDGLSFSSKIKDSIFFEYHDVSHNHGLPPMNLVFARDMASFMTKDGSSKWFEDINEVLKPGGVVILGKNEKPPVSTDWKIEKSEHMYVAYK